MRGQANLTIEDVTIRNMWGSTSGKGDPLAGTLVCSADDVSDTFFRAVGWCTSAVLILLVVAVQQYSRGEHRGQGSEWEDAGV